LNNEDRREIIWPLISPYGKKRKGLLKKMKMNENMCMPVN
jgi:hypothetical protein